MTEAQHISRCIARVNILIEGVKYTLDDLKDIPDVVRHRCRCGTWTRFDECGACYIERLKEQRGL